MRVKLQNCRLNGVLEAAAFRIANLQSFGLRVCSIYIYAWMHVEICMCGYLFNGMGLTATMLMFLVSAWEILRELYVGRILPATYFHYINAFICS